MLELMIARANKSARHTDDKIFFLEMLNGGYALAYGVPHGCCNRALSVGIVSKAKLYDAVHSLCIGLEFRNDRTPFIGFHFCVKEVYTSGGYRHSLTVYRAGEQVGHVPTAYGSSNSMNETIHSWLYYHEKHHGLQLPANPYGLRGTRYFREVLNSSYSTCEVKRVKDL